MLRLNENQFGDEAARELGRALKVNSTLVELSYVIMASIKLMTILSVILQALGMQDRRPWSHSDRQRSGT